MKGCGFILAVVIVLLIFGLPLLGCFMGLLVIGFGMAADASLPCGMFLTVALVVGMGIKVFFFDP